MKERLASVPVIGWLLRVQDRFSEVNGTALANGIALQAFLSIFPLLIVAISVIGFIAQGDGTFAGDVIDAFGLTGSAAMDMREAIANAQDSKAAAGIIGLLGLLWTGLAVITAVQRSVDLTWQTVPRGLRDKLRAVAWLLGAGVIFVGSFALGVLINFLPGFFAPLSIIAGIAVNVVLFLWTFTALSRLPVSWRACVPGALAGAVGFEVLKLIGAVYIPRLVANSSQLYGSLGIVVAIIAWLAFFGRLLVYSSVINVIRYEDEHGTLTVPIHVPRVPGAIALEANRAGGVTDRLEE